MKGLCMDFVTNFEVAQNLLKLWHANFFEQAEKYEQTGFGGGGGGWTFMHVFEALFARLWKTTLWGHFFT